MKTLMNYRIKKLREEIKKRGLDALLVTSPPNRYYLLDIENSIEGVCLITKNNAYFLTDFLYFEEASRCNIGTGNWSIKLVQQRTNKGLEEILKYHNIRKLGIEPDYMSLSRYLDLKKIKKLKLLPVKNLVEALRIIKDRDEIRNIRRACALTTKGFSYILKIIKPGITEREIANKLDYFLKTYDDVAFSTIVASGVRSSFPHAMPSEKRLCCGDAVVMDFGVKYKGYHADFTRTIFIGKADKKKISLYSLILEAQKRAIDKIKDGMPCKKVDAQARSLIEKKGYGKYFGHSLGHGVGRNIHEKPHLGKENKSPLRENMVVTVEPAVYIPGRFGIRIEDTVLVKKNGCEILTDFPKNITEI